MNDITLEKLHELGFEDHRLKHWLIKQSENPGVDWIDKTVDSCRKDPYLTRELGNADGALIYQYKTNTVDIESSDGGDGSTTLRGISTIQKVKDIIEVLSTTK